MKIARPLLLVTTPVGVAIGLYEGYRLAGGLVIVMAAMLTVIGIAMISVVRTIRRERDAERRDAALPENETAASARTHSPAREDVE